MTRRDRRTHFYCFHSLVRSMNFTSKTTIWYADRYCYRATAVLQLLNCNFMKFIISLAVLWPILLSQSVSSAPRHTAMLNTEYIKQVVTV